MPTVNELAKQRGIDVGKIQKQAKDAVKGPPDSYLSTEDKMTLKRCKNYEPNKIIKPDGLTY